MARTKLIPWKQEIEWAARICSQLGCEVERSTADYEIAKVKGSGVSLVIYPHKTTAGHHHARVRDNGSKNRLQAGRVMAALDAGEGLPEKEADRVRFSCTFSAKKPIRTAVGGGQQP